MAQFSQDESGNYFGEHGQPLHKDYWGNLIDGNQHVGKLDYWGNVETQESYGLQTHQVTFRGPTARPAAVAEPAPIPPGPLMSRQQSLDLLQAPLTKEQLAHAAQWEAGRRRSRARKIWTAFALLILLGIYLLARRH